MRGEERKREGEIEFMQGDLEEILHEGESKVRREKHAR